MANIFTTPDLITAFSIKAAGNMRIKPSGHREIDKWSHLNRQKFIESLGVHKGAIISAESEHRANVVKIEKNSPRGVIKDTDALITDQPDVVLNLSVADCLAIFIYDPRGEVIALAHGGWRGLHAGVIENVIRELQSSFGTNGSDLLVGFGPAIGGCHYEIGKDVLDKFSDYPSAIRKERGRSYLDIRTVAKEKLIKLGVLEENIEVNLECTYELPQKYFSFRRDKPKILESMLAVMTRISI